LRDLAHKLGLKINEYGIFDIKTNKKIGGKIEEEIYKKLGLPFIPPELRENIGEIEAAKKDNLPKLLELSDIKGDIHIHTKYSDGDMTFEQVAEKSKEREYEWAGICDHSQSTKIANGLDIKTLMKKIEEVRKVNEKLKNIKGISVAYVGDGNNVCNSLLHACSKVGINMNIATPKGYEPDKTVLNEARVIAKTKKATINLSAKPKEAVKDVDVIYTDVWTSMGQEKEAKMRKRIFKEFQINKSLVRLAKKNALIMHCLPAHRGEEITDEIMESKNSVIFDQAENRMHVQKAILIKLLGEER
jgi:ornithine carbamoyltransferase